jgi:raffinose/stachyose/melibiose transport system substrate-binding protein
MITRGTAALAAALAAAVVALTGCGESGSSDPGVLRLWHYEGPDSAMGVAWAKAIEEFEASHPGVRVEFEEKGFEQIRKTAPMVLNSAEAPDLMEYNKGNATTGLLSKQGLLTDLSEQAASRGWDELLAPGLQTTARYDENGVMGSGRWYGVPNYAEYVTVYYNEDAFAAQGVAVPTTFEEFTAALEEFRAAGTTPIAMSGAEYPASQLLYQLALSKADRDWVDRFQRYTGDVDFHDEAWVHGAETFKSWVDAGYIGQDTAGQKAEDMGVSFIEGRHPIMISGTWWQGRLTAEVQDFQWGSFPFPGSTMTLGASGNHWVVPQGSKNKELAYDFIDITMRTGVQNALGEAGGLPVAAEDGRRGTPDDQQVVENFAKISAADGLAYYPDWPAPGYYDVLVSATQKLMAGSASPHEVLAEIEAPYRENLPNVGK